MDRHENMLLLEELKLQVSKHMADLKKANNATTSNQPPAGGQTYQETDAPDDEYYEYNKANSEKHHFPSYRNGRGWKRYPHRREGPPRRYGYSGFHNHRESNHYSYQPRDYQRPDNRNGSQWQSNSHQKGGFHSNSRSPKYFGRRHDRYRHSYSYRQDQPIYTARHEGLPQDIQQQPPHHTPQIQAPPRSQTMG